MRTIYTRPHVISPRCWCDRYVISNSDGEHYFHNDALGQALGLRVDGVVDGTAAGRIYAVVNDGSYCQHVILASELRESLRDCEG